MEETERDYPAGFQQPRKYSGDNIECAVDFGDECQGIVKFGDLFRAFTSFRPVRLFELCLTKACTEIVGRCSYLSLAINTLQRLLLLTIPNNTIVRSCNEV